MAVGRGCREGGVEWRWIIQKVTPWARGDVHYAAVSIG